MNGKKNGFMSRVARFFSGGGFYIALFLCVAMIGIYAWALLVSGVGVIRNPQTETEDLSLPVGSFGTGAILSGDYATSAPRQQTEGTPEDRETWTAPEDGEARPVSAGAEDGGAATDSAPREEVPSFYAWPVPGEVTRGYTVEALAYDVTMGDWRTHGAVDLLADMGTKVYAVADGTVSDIQRDPLMGTVVVLSHVGGFRSIYGNLGTEPTVRVGDTVTAGTVIGCVSDSALGEIAQASHLHFALEKDGVRVDPAAWLPKK